MNAIATTTPGIEGLEQVLINGDLSGLTPDQAIAYYRRVCDSVGLNPLTQPFEYLKLNGKMILYARRAATEQLRRLHNVSITIVSRETIEGCCVVTARATLPSGRCDENLGAVPINGLKGEALCNAIMKAECVPLDSEILTREGWKTHDQLVIGEEVLAYDLDTDSCRWTPVRNVTTYKDVPVSRLASTKGLFSVRCTPNHSWAVKGQPYAARSENPKGPYKSRKALRRLVEAQHINKSQRVILAAAEPGAEDSLLSPVEAAVLGWAVTDGTIQRRGSFVRVGVCQSKEENFPAIREMVALAAGSDVNEVVSPARARTFPTGRTYDTKAQHWWYLPSAVGRALLQKAGYQDRYDLPRIVTRLSSAARKAMIQAMMLAEGDKRGIFANGDRHILDAFEILCALEGVATGTRTPKDTVFTQRQKKTRHVAGSFLSLTADGSADVWCPTTDLGTWVMRQNGRVMITGNTKAKRRVTLAICGLAFLDDSEVEGVRGAERVPVPVPPPQLAVVPAQPSEEPLEPGERQTVAAMFGTKLRANRTQQELVAWMREVIRAEFDKPIRETLWKMFRMHCTSLNFDANLLARRAQQPVEV